MTEIIAKITEAEKQAAQVRRQAQQNVKDIEAIAHEQGRKELTRAKESATAKANQILEKAQEEAREMHQQQTADTAQKSQTLLEEAMAHMEEATALIVERIVGSR